MYTLTIDEKKFTQALTAAQTRVSRGVGTLDEKLLHAALKNYFAPPERQEVKVGRQIVDAVGEETLYEIQTCGCHPLAKKLPSLLREHRVTVVCPIMRRKTLFWIDAQSGETSPGRKSPKTGGYPDILPELIYLSPFANDENFTLALFLYDGEEYRLTGAGANAKRRSRRVERKPTAPVGLTVLESGRDFRFLLPENCPDSFSSGEFSRLIRRRGRQLWAALKALTEQGVIDKEKNGRTVVYTVRKGDIE